MYILVRIGINDFRSAELCSRQKKKLEEHIKRKGFYWSSKTGRYIDDRTVKNPGGSGTDYIIKKLDELV